MRKGVSPFVATLILTSLSIVILGDVIKLQLNETIPIGKQILRFITNTGRLWKQEFFVPNNWVLSDWSERKGIVIDNTHSLELKNYQISVDPNLTITDGLVFHAHMGDEGNLVVDYSGNNNDGKLYGNTRALFKFDEGLDNKTYDSSSYANNGNFYGGNDGTYYGNNPHTQSNSTVLQLTGSSPINLTHSFYLPSKAILSDVNLTVYYKNNTANLGYNTINVYVNGNYIGSFNDSGETSTANYTFVNILKSNFTAGALNNITYEGNVTNITQSTLKYLQDIGWVDGKFGKALSFDGVDDYVEVPHSTSLNVTEKISILFWTRTTQTTEGWALAKGSRWNPQYALTIRGDSDGRVEFRLYIAGTTVSILGVKTGLNDGKWHLIGATYDGSKMNIFYDGVLDKSINQTGIISSNTYPLTLGLDIVTQTKFMGDIDDVRIYNRALTAPTQDKNGDGVINCTDEPETEICSLYLAKTSLEDLRFTDREGNLLPYYHESDNRIWVKLDIPANSTKVIYMYYGNPSATSQSNGTATFDFFDDFEGTSLDTSKWDFVGDYSISNGIVTINPNLQEEAGTIDGISVRDGIYSKSTFRYPVEIRTKIAGHTDFVRYRLGLLGLYYGYDDAGSCCWALRLNQSSVVIWGYDVPTNGLVGDVVVRINSTHFYLKDSSANTPQTWAYGLNNNPNNYRVIVSSWYASNIRIDFVTVRKYTSPEPTTSVGNEEVSP